MFSLFEKNSIKIFSVIALLTLVPYLLLSSYIFPVADDFSYALQGIDSIWDHYKINYLNWCGRYTSNFIVLLNGFITPNIFLYRLYPILLIITIVFSIYILTRKINFQDATFPAFLFSLLFTSVYLNILPNTAEGLYWYTGSVTYVLPVFLFVLYVLLAQKIIVGSWLLNRWFHLLLMAITAIVIIGFNESLMLLFVCMHVIVFLLLKKTAESKRVFFIFILLCIAASLVIILAPGNENRSAFFPQRHRLFYSLVYSTAQTARFSLKWMLSPALLLFTVFYIPYADKINKNVVWDKFISINIIFIFIGLLFVIFCAVFPPYWATGMLGQHRTLNTILIVFMFFWLVFIHILVHRFSDSYILSTLSKNKKTIFFLLIFSLVFTGNGYTAISDLFQGRAAAFKTQLNDRDIKFKNAHNNGLKQFTVDTLHCKPSSIFVLDITTDSTHWINYSYAEYYKLDFVKGK